MATTFKQTATQFSDFNAENSKHTFEGLGFYSFTGDIFINVEFDWSNNYEGTIIKN